MTTPDYARPPCAHPGARWADSFRRWACPLCGIRLASKRNKYRARWGKGKSRTMRTHGDVTW